jgi:hypothetical protein
MGDFPKWATYEYRVIATRLLIKFASIECPTVRRINYAAPLPGKTLEVSDAPEETCG